MRRAGAGYAGTARPAWISQSSPIPWPWSCGCRRCTARRTPPPAAESLPRRKAASSAPPASALGPAASPPPGTALRRARSPRPRGPPAASASRAPCCTRRTAGSARRSTRRAAESAKSARVLSLSKNPLLYHVRAFPFENAKKAPPAQAGGAYPHKIHPVPTDGDGTRTDVFQRARIFCCSEL